MRKILFFILLSLFSFAAFALSTDIFVPRDLKCSKNGTTVIYVNGIRVKKAEASKDMKYISGLHKMVVLDKPKKAIPAIEPKVNYDLSYNTNLSSILDFVESGAQKLILEKGLT